MAEERVRLQAIVEGVVQGVNFRHYTILTARRLGLTGWVANRFDGTVETVAEGPRAAVQSLLAFLQEGPPSAEVARVTERWGKATGEFADFRVAYR